MKSDRIFGLISLTVALAFIASATQIQTSFIVDPLGPKSFPIIIGSLLAIASLVPIFKPDPDPAWPNRERAGKIAIALVVLLGYTFILDDLGFIISTTFAAGLISYQIRDNVMGAAITGVSLAAVLFLVFNAFLGLSLVGWPKFLGL